MARFWDYVKDYAAVMSWVGAVMLASTGLVLIHDAARKLGTYAQIIIDMAAVSTLVFLMLKATGVKK